MADICTMVIATTMNAVACFSPVQCGPEQDGRIFCSGGGQSACPSIQPYYECKREDGSTYQLDWTKGPTTILTPNSR